MSEGTREPGADDIDAEFRDLVARLGGEAEAELSDSRAGDAVPIPTGEGRDELDTPVDEALHLDEGRLSVALVLAPVTSPEALHSLLAIAGVRRPVVRVKPWCAVWLSVAQPCVDDEFEQFLSDGCRMPPEVDEVARVVSRLSKFGAVAMMSWLVEDGGLEVGVSGQITARRYVGGEPEEDIPAGLLLGTLPQAAEDLLLGRAVPEDFDDSVDSEGRGGRRRGPFGFWRRK